MNFMLFFVIFNLITQSIVFGAEPSDQYNLNKRLPEMQVNLPESLRKLATSINDGCGARQCTETTYLLKPSETMLQELAIIDTIEKIVDFFSTPNGQTLLELAYNPEDPEGIFRSVRYSFEYYYLENKFPSLLFIEIISPRNRILFANEEFKKHIKYALYSLLSPNYTPIWHKNTNLQLQANMSLEKDSFDTALLILSNIGGKTQSEITIAKNTLITLLFKACISHIEMIYYMQTRLSQIDCMEIEKSIASDTVVILRKKEDAGCCLIL